MKYLSFESRYYVNIEDSPQRTQLYGEDEVQAQRIDAEYASLGKSWTPTYPTNSGPGEF